MTFLERPAPGCSRRVSGTVIAGLIAGTLVAATSVGALRYAATKRPTAG